MVYSVKVLPFIYLFFGGGWEGEMGRGGTGGTTTFFYQIKVCSVGGSLESILYHRRCEKRGRGWGTHKIFSQTANISS